MRIIAGTFRSRHLLPLKKLKVRPTSNMLRETLFNILGPRVEHSRFLDLFAGTGAVGIEAVSRGANSVAFVENYTLAARLIEQNLASLAITNNVRVIKSDALQAIARLESERQPPFDFVFLDPPYAAGRDYHAVLHALENSPLVATDTILIAEHRKTFDLPESIGRLGRYRVLRQGDAALSFFGLSSS